MLGCCADKQFGKGCTPDTCMALPDGKMCSDCVHLKRCMAFGYIKYPQTSCDFFPRRFVGAEGENHG